MPTATLVPTATAATEPVSVALAVTHLRLDLDLTSQEPTAQAEREYVHLLLSAARQACEGFTGRYFAGGQTLELTFTLSEPYALPLGATATAVRGFFTRVEDAQAFDWVEYQKGASIERQLPLADAARQTYTVTVELPEAVAAACPALVKAAILELTEEWYKNRGTSSGAGIVPRELPVSYQAKLAPLNIRPVLY